MWWRSLTWVRWIFEYPTWRRSSLSSCCEPGCDLCKPLENILIAAYTVLTNLITAFVYFSTIWVHSSIILESVDGHPHCIGSYCIRQLCQPRGKISNFFNARPDRLTLWHRIPQDPSTYAFITFHHGCDTLDNSFFSALIFRSWTSNGRNVFKIIYSYSSKVHLQGAY